MQLPKEDELKRVISFAKGENIISSNSKNVVQGADKKNIQQGSNNNVKKDHIKVFHDIRKNFLGQDS